MSRQYLAAIVDWAVRGWVHSVIAIIALAPLILAVIVKILNIDAVALGQFHDPFLYGALLWLFALLPIAGYSAWREALKETQTPERVGEVEWLRAENAEMWRAIVRAEQRGPVEVIISLVDGERTARFVDLKGLVVAEATVTGTLSVMTPGPQASLVGDVQSPSSDATSSQDHT